jgi:2,3-bisphosphoglycerate-dependent phosphoglycerate mutase
VAEHRQIRFAAPPGSARILLVRHGESAAYEEDRPFALVDGHGDPPLRDPDGLEQAERVGERLAGEDIAAIYVTPLQRTAQTAAPLARRLGLEPRVERELREVHLGEWENGGLRKHTREGHPLILEILAEQRWDVLPGAEPTADFEERVRGGIERIAAAHPDETVAAFVHGGVIGRVLATATGSRGLAFAAADNGSISEVVVVPDGHWVVRRFNDTAHLAP